MTYNWQFPNWAEFTYNDSVIDSLTTVFALETGEIISLEHKYVYLPEDVEKEEEKQVVELEEAFA